MTCYNMLKSLFHQGSNKQILLNGEKKNMKPTLKLSQF